VGKWDFLRPCDEAVQAALAAGNIRQAFEILLQGYHKVVVQFCITLLGNKADGEDAAQDTFVAIFDALPDYEPRDLLRAWVFQIARNQCYKFWRQLWTRIDILTTYSSAISAVVMSGPPSPDPALEILEQYLQDRLEPSLRRLPRRDRVLLLMYYWEELSFRAMARQLRLSEATVRRAVHAAEARLRTLMTQDKMRDDA
jgi:RNA polymerase sigma-70 factor, ECF subfamily